MKILDWRAVIVTLGLSEHVYRMPAHILLEALRYHSADLVILDPPSLIGVGATDDDRNTAVDEHVEALVPVADQTARVLKFGGVAVAMGEPLVLSAWDMVAGWSGLQFAGDMAVLWDESTESIDSRYKDELSLRRRHALLKPSDFPSLFTNVRWYVKPGYRLPFNPSRSIEQSTNVVVCRQVPSIYRHHVTQRPVELYNYLISLFTEPGGLVVDPFCGSGSALVAAKMCDRRWVGGDVDHRQCVVARKRLGTAEIEESYLQPMMRWVRGKLEKIEG